ncbi:Transcriptional regulatory protein qseB [Vibrio nigripulchritudo MADA3029]|uniref:Transcriptional regulatory protein qseB n=2 Tax=Vibrio nigripulchritudo TaxID=28173 RepID=U4K0Z8_9VIBR|nr:MULTISPECIES: response regulator transcription factor [Vibrio]EGU59734.1 two component transcriptional regulator [Vibrio nigripulchritudo ATCC 27043]UAB69819.1 response regulator transcription factor [Vibrio sp. SCSIO 43132]CCN38038.1 Transcriptional regulatory protein qseB [Vibrio nigripulchritudo AM115]CCN39052.1 Transcriptional regulatory protein qseB [Vibrio nigripulchritudo FTn2]CCN45139.1 Transcriptional regulatory protein qseB [Vibrio nigripulchritudo MADA3020]
MRALVVEDNIQAAEQISEALTGHGFIVDVTHDGNDAWFQGDTEEYDIAILDLGLPGKDGLSVLTEWRRAGNKMPVIILTARDTWREKVTGLRAGADDYLVKPFEMEELLARIEALVRRSNGHASSVLKCGDIEVDTATQRATLKGAHLDLSSLEYRLLAYLINHQGEVVSKATLTEHLYQMDFEHNSNVIEVLVNRVRKKMGTQHIQTRRGLGYQLNEQG